MSSQDHAISLRVTKIKIHGSDLNFHRGKYIFTAIVDKKKETGLRKMMPEVWGTWVKELMKTQIAMIYHSRNY